MQAYGTPGGEFGVCRAAVITEVGIPLGGETADPAGRVGICVMNPTGLFFNRGIPYDEKKTGEGEGWGSGSGEGSGEDVGEGSGEGGE